MNIDGVVSWDDFKPVLRQFNCPCCMGVRVMPDGEELEKLLLENLDLLGDDYQKLTNENKNKQNSKKGGENVEG